MYSKNNGKKAGQQIEISLGTTSLSVTVKAPFKRDSFFLCSLIQQLFFADESTWRRHHGGVLLFDISPSSLPTGEVEEAELRVLFPNFVDEAVELSVYQYLGPHNKRYILDKRTTYLSSHSTKWCSFDISGAVTAWIAGVRNFGLQIECSFCGAFLQPLEAYVNVLAAPRGRFRRSSPLQKYDERGRTDCKNSSDGNRKCCRHKMTVTFKDLNVPQVSSIIQPKSYEAFYCKGRCPVNYNHATNHSRIQNLVHRMDKKVIPRVCCAPSKLEPLEILRVDPYNTDKLVLERWDNMRVLECACSQSKIPPRMFYYLPPECASNSD